jgi:hypothetical protein
VKIQNHLFNRELEILWAIYTQEFNDFKNNKIELENISKSIFFIIKLIKFILKVFFSYNHSDPI